MAIRALDVGTSRTPLIGQPSSADEYIDSDRPIAHPGPWHFYMLAGPVRLFGGMGMVLVSVLMVGTCLLVSAWAVFRQLGASAALVAAVVLGAITFTTGTSSLVDPVSSRSAGYPLLCSAVLLWCVLVGDLRLLPLATAVVSFTAQQHLSVAPATVLLTLGTLAGFGAWFFARHRYRAPEVRRQLRWAVTWSVLVALVMWAPPLLDQFFGEGNLGNLAHYVGSRDRETLGWHSAFRQLSHTLGVPPLLGRTEFSGQWILSDPSLLTWLSALLVMVIVAVLGFRWWSTDRRKSGLAIMVGLVAAAGLVNGSSVPVGLEQSRAAFYHWTFVLAFFVWLVLGLGALALLRRTDLGRRPMVTPALVSVALAAIILPSIVNLTLERRTNTLDGTHAFWSNSSFDRLGDSVAAHRSELGARPVLMGPNLFTSYPEALAFELDRRGIDVEHTEDMRGFVDDERMADRRTVTSGLFLKPFHDGDPASKAPGELLAVVHLRRGVDPDGAFAFGVTGYRLYLLDRDQVLAAVADRPGLELR